MKKSLKKISSCIICFILISVVTSANAQQQANYTQYMFNGLILNPAYAGSDDAINVSALGRWQWVGLEGAPSTQTFSVHSPIPRYNIGLGLQFTHEEIGVSKESNIIVSYAYKVQLNQSSVLSMGLNLGLSTFTADFSRVGSLSDPTFQESVSQTSPNVGVGIYYSSSNMYLGLSSPQLLVSDKNDLQASVIKRSRHYFLTGGVVLDLSRNIKVKPNFLIKAVDGSPLSVDLNVNLLFQETIWFGVSYRAPESIGFLFQANLSESFRIGYALDYILDSSLKQLGGNSHEFMINYRFNVGGNRYKRPKYF